MREITIQHSVNGPSNIRAASKSVAPVPRLPDLAARIGTSRQMFAGLPQFRNLHPARTLC